MSGKTSTITSEQELFELWLDHPIVKQAVRMADDDPDSFLDVLENLHAVLSELDRRFPGIPYRSVLEATRATEDQDRLEAIRTLRSAGVSVEDQSLVVPNYRQPAGTELQEELAELLLSGAGWREVVQAGWASTKRSAYEILRIRQPVSSLERALLEDLDKPGATLNTVAKRHGSSANTVRTARRKREYRRYIAERKAAA